MSNGREAPKAAAIWRRQVSAASVDMVLRTLVVQVSMKSTLEIGTQGPVVYSAWLSHLTVSISARLRSTQRDRESLRDTETPGRDWSIHSFAIDNYHRFAICAADIGGDIGPKRFGRNGATIESTPSP